MDIKQILYTLYVIIVVLPLFLVLTILTAVIAAVGSILGAERVFGYWPGKIWSIATLALLLIPVKVSGREYLPRTCPSVVTPNHTSAMDIFLLYGYAGVRFKWVLKGSLRKLPFVGWACEKLGFIFVENTPSGAIRVVRDCEKAIANGYHIFMFPEGSRTLTGKLDRLRKGAFKVATEMGVPIVPAKITGGYEILKRGTSIPKWGRLTLQFFPALETNQGATIEELMQKVKERLQ